MLELLQRLRTSSMKSYLFDQYKVNALLWVGENFFLKAHNKNVSFKKEWDMICDACDTAQKIFSSFCIVRVFRVKSKIKTIET